jgi:hypothetical protein
MTTQRPRNFCFSLLFSETVRPHWLKWRNKEKHPLDWPFMVSQWEKTGKKNKDTLTIWFPFREDREYKTKDNTKPKTTTLTLVWFWFFRHMNIWAVIQPLCYNLLRIRNTVVVIFVVTQTQDSIAAREYYSRMSFCNKVELLLYHSQAAKWCNI